jgi:hypothetical protein
VALGEVFLLVFRLSPVCIILPILDTHLHLHAAGTRRINGRRLGTLQKQCFLEIGKHWVEKYFFFILPNSKVCWLQMPVRDDAPNLSMKCVITCSLVRVYHAIQGAVKNEYRVVAERRLAGWNRKNSVETPLHHHVAEYYTKSNELCNTLDQGWIYHEANEV